MAAHPTAASTDISRLSTLVILAICWAGVLAAVVLSVWCLIRLIPSAERERDYQRERIVFVERQIAEAERAITINRKMLEQMQSDPEYLEWVAQRRLRWVRPGDVIIQVEPATPHKP
jgi:cell division protein FtsB